MKYFFYIAVIVIAGGCSVRKNNFFSRNYHQLTTRYNVYFNGNQALKSGVRNMENRHKEDYTNLLPVFVSNDEQTRALCRSDMDDAVEKALKAIDRHSITAKPRRKKNRHSANDRLFRSRREFNGQLDKCYLLLGKAYFYQRKYAMANTTFRFIQRQYKDEPRLMAQTALWMFRSLTEMGRYDEAAKCAAQVNAGLLKGPERELWAAACTDFYVRQGEYARAVPEAEKLAGRCKSLKRRPRYRFLLAQLYLKNGREAQAMEALQKSVRFNFNYEMVFNAKINMALAGRDESTAVEKRLKRMLRDPKNKDYQDRIYYALGDIEEKRGNEAGAVGWYWKSVQASVDNDSQQALSFRKLGDYYFKERDYQQAQGCYDSCLYLVDSRYEDYDKLQTLLADLTDLVTNLRTIQVQDSLQRLAALPETERDRIIDGKIEAIKEEERRAKEQELREQAERNFYDRNSMFGSTDNYLQHMGGEWYFYNPVTIALGKNEFKRKWGRRKLEDNWRRRNKAMAENVMPPDEPEQERSPDDREMDVKSREYYLKALPLTEAGREKSEKEIGKAYLRAGELYLYTFADPQRAAACFDAYIRRFQDSKDLPMVYYLACRSVGQAGDAAGAERYREELLRLFPESDFAREVLEPGYFRKVEDIRQAVGRRYAQAFERYRMVYYDEAERICDEILEKYPGSELQAYVLFLKAMCVANLRPEEARPALEQALAVCKDKNRVGVVRKMLAALSAGQQPAAYSPADMAESRYMRSHRNWKFDEGVRPGPAKKEKTAYQADRNQEYAVVLVLPEQLKPGQENRFKARMNFIHAGEAAEGKSYEMKKEELWYHQAALVIRKFERYREAGAYLNRVATDKYLLKIIGKHDYRMFAISAPNLAVLKQMKNIDAYADFFVENYFADRRQGEILVGKRGAAAHIFNDAAADENHYLVLSVPFREANTRRIAEALHQFDPAFSMVRLDYGNLREMVVMKNVGHKGQALERMAAALKDKTVLEQLSGIDYDAFVITESNLKAVLDNEYYDEYLEFFNAYYLKTAGAVEGEKGERLQ